MIVAIVAHMLLKNSVDLRPCLSANEAAAKLPKTPPSSYDEIVDVLKRRVRVEQNNWYAYTVTSLAPIYFHHLLKGASIKWTLSNRLA